MKESPSTKWQSQLSSGFESLLVFASTELDRSKRKSTDEGIRTDVAVSSKGSRRKNSEQDLSKDADILVGRFSEFTSGKSPKDSPSQTKDPSRSSSVESRSSRSSKRYRDLSRSATSESLSPLRHRSQSRSRSPHDRDNNDDKYYEKLFKKKFYGVKAQVESKGEEASKYTHGSQFRPKGKDWKKNMPVKEGIFDGKEPNLQEGIDQGIGSLGKASSDTSKSEAIGNPELFKTKSSTPPSRPQSSGSHSSAFQPTLAHGQVRETSPHSRSQNSLHTPSPTSSLQRPPSAGLPGISPLSTTPLSRSSPGGPPSRPGSDHFPLPGPFGRTGHPTIAAPLIAGLLPGLPGTRFPDIPVEAARLAALGFDAARLPFFDLRGFNLVPGIRPPMISDLGSARLVNESRPGESGGQRHSFGGEPQMFNPLARHGKDPLWND